MAAQTDNTSPAASDAGSQEEGKPRLRILSNRLPITISKTDTPGKFDTKMSSGGLVSGLSGMTKTTKFTWYGWPGLQIPDEQLDGFKGMLAEKYNAVPVMLEENMADKHYNGMSSK